MIKQIPWQRLFNLAVCMYNISPGDFWGMTIRELQLLQNQQAVPATDELQELMRQFPDQ